MVTGVHEFWVPALHLMGAGVAGWAIWRAWRLRPPSAWTFRLPTLSWAAEGPDADHGGAVGRGSELGLRVRHGCRRHAGRRGRGRVIRPGTGSTPRPRAASGSGGVPARR